MGRQAQLKRARREQAEYVASLTTCEGTWLEIWIPPLGIERERAEDSGSRDYEMLYNAVVERDGDRDGFGDVTQDNCPKNPAKQEGC